MAYIEIHNKETDENYWLKDPVFYNIPGQRLFLIRVGCHSVDMCIPYWKSMDWNNGVSRIYFILRELGLGKEVIRVDTGKGVYLEDCLFIAGTKGKIRKALVFTMKVREPFPVNVQHNECGTVYHHELFGKNEKIYPDLGNQRKG